MPTTKEYLPELGLWKTEDTYHMRVDTFYSIDKDKKILHRNDDLPAKTSVQVNPDNTIKVVEEHWYKFGIEHRDGDLPSSISRQVVMKYCKHGKLHRVNGPAYTWADVEYTGDTADYPKGTFFEWFLNGNYGRNDGGPTAIHDGKKLWQMQNLIDQTILHNSEGPAVIHPDGKVEFWLNGVQLSDDEFARATQHKVAGNELAFLVTNATI